jgi:D-arabinose 1-dehydrogenase-like Zn-dependent alcohol dehydrogenase
VRVHASGICNSDHFIKDGTWPGVQYPRIPGHEIIGRIADVGTDLLKTSENRDRFRIGALVGVGWNGGYCTQCDFCRKGEFWTCRNVDYTGFTIDGGHAEYMFATSSAIIHIPEEYLKGASYAELAPLCCAGATVFHAILTSKRSPGDLCLVQGVGGLGHLAIQYANKLGMKVHKETLRGKCV